MGEDDITEAIFAHLDALRSSQHDLHRKVDILMTAAGTEQAAIDAITAELVDVKTKVTTYQQGLTDQIVALEAQIAANPPGTPADLTALKAAADALPLLEAAPVVVVPVVPPVVPPVVLPLIPPAPTATAPTDSVLPPPAPTAGPGA